jgi:hypothetical protein
VGIKINDIVEQNFQTKKGIRQDNPLSLLLFNIVVYMLAVLTNRAKSEGQTQGVIPHLTDDGLSILQYADDTILFMGHNIDQAQNIKLLLSAFEQISGLKIISIRVSYSALVKQKRTSDSMHNYSVVKLDLNPSGI